MGRRTWIKIFADNWLTGTLREETSSIRGTWIDVLALAGDSTYGDEGLIQVADGVGLTDEQITAILCITINQWSEAKQRLIDTDRIQISKHNVIKIIKWKRYQSEYERTKEAQKRYREKKSIPQNYHSKLSPIPIKEKREERREKRDKEISKDSKAGKPVLSKITKDLLDKVYKQGFNIYALLGRFKKKSKINLPEAVIEKVCNSYLKNHEKIQNDWPWFITAVEKASREYFAEQSIKENQEYKKQPVAQSIKEIMRIAGLKGG